MTRPEDKVISMIESMLDSSGRYYVNLHGHGFGKAGAPDFITNDSNGIMTGIECKSVGEEPCYNQWRHGIRILLSTMGVTRYIVAYSDFTLEKFDAGDFPTMKIGCDEAEDAFVASVADKRHTVEVVLEEK